MFVILEQAAGDRTAIPVENIITFRQETPHTTCVDWFANGAAHSTVVREGIEPLVRRVNALRWVLSAGSEEQPTGEQPVHAFTPEEIKPLRDEVVAYGEDKPKGWWKVDLAAQAPLTEAEWPASTTKQMEQERPSWPSPVRVPDTVWPGPYPTLTLKDEFFATLLAALLSQNEATSAAHTRKTDTIIDLLERTLTAVTR